MYISDFFSFETSSQIFLSNMLRDFQKTWNYKKYENAPFSRPIFHQKQSDIASKKYFKTISTEKQRKCTSQIFDFLNFITEIFCQTCWEIFKYHEIIKKIWKLPIFLVNFPPETVENAKQKISLEDQHGKL